MIKIENLRKSYENNNMLIEILHGVTCEIKDGEMVAIMGESGTGKSTLLSILGCLNKQTSGHLVFNDEDVYKIKEKQLYKFRRDKCGFIFQQHNLIPDYSALDNVLLPARYSGKLRKKEALNRALELLDNVGMKEKYASKVRNMSGGESQRVAIARALMNKPELLLADEPTGSLDRENTDKVMNLLKDIHNNQNQTIVIVTHDMHVAKMCERIMWMHNGVITNDNFQF